MNPMAKNFRQHLNELLEYIKFLEREIEKLTKENEKLKNNHK